MEGIILDLKIVNSINEKLKEIELKENIKIILAVESGSRAWGFESPDSDYDVRFIYIRQIEEYLRLNEKRDVIEWQLDEVYDISGWDIKKALKLMYKSNPALNEWLNSPIVYYETKEADALRTLSKEYFQIKRTALHYYGIAKSSYIGALDKETVKLKKYFYVLRAILAGEWVLKYKSQAPILFEELLQEVTEEEIKETILTLLEKKKMQSELGEGSKIVNLDDYIVRNALVIKKEAEEIFEDIKAWDRLDEFFVKIVNDK